MSTRKKKRPVPTGSGASEKPGMEPQVPPALALNTPVPDTAQPPAASFQLTDLETDYQSWPKPTGGTQPGVVFDILTTNFRQEVSALTLQTATNALAVHSVISNLRSDDHLVIQNRVVRHSIDGRHWTSESYYKLMGRLPAHLRGNARKPGKAGDDGGSQGATGAVPGPVPG